MNVISVVSHLRDLGKLAGAIFGNNPAASVQQLSYSGKPVVKLRQNVTASLGTQKTTTKHLRKTL